MASVYRKALPQGDTPLTAQDQHPNFRDIPGLQIAFQGGEAIYYHISLTASDTWNDQAGCGAWFAICLDDQVVARGLYTTGVGGQRVPIHIETVLKIGDGRHVVEAKWCTHAGGKAYIGGLGETVLLMFSLDQISVLSEGDPV